MTHRLTKEQLDEQFELFLKESVSDDSVDFGSSDKKTFAKTSKKSTQKPTVSWWPDDDQSDGGAERAEKTKSRFIKSKKSQPESNDVITAEPVLKPVPKPRSKALEKVLQLEKTYKETLHRAPSDDPHSDSLSASTRANLQSESEERRSDETQSCDSPAASSEGLSQGGSEDGKSFRKSLRRSQSIQEEVDAEESGPKEEGFKEAASMRDDAEILAMAPAANTTSLGLDTLEEEEEKARFFSQFESGASSTIDYSRLNKELDSTSSTDFRKAEGEEEQSDEDKKKGRIIERESPGSPHYSEDFEEEDNRKEPQEEKSKMSPILAKVSLYDSLDDTGGDNREKLIPASEDKGQSYVQSGGSEMEALQEAYRQIHVVEDSEDHERHYSDLESREGVDRSASPPSPPPRHIRQSLQPASTAESELPTAEELMRPIRPEVDQNRGFSLQPVSAAESNQEKTPRPLEGTFVTSPEEHVNLPEQATGKEGLKGSTSHWSNSPDSPHYDPTWSIRQEVERLMKDQDKPDSHASSQAGKTKKQQTSFGSTFSHPSTSTVRKPTPASVRGRRVEGRTAVTSRSSGMSRAVAATKTQTVASRPLQGKSKVTKSQEKEDYADPGLRASNELVSSVQSLVSVLQQQIDTSRHREVAAFPQDPRLTHQLQDNKGEEEDCFLVEELRSQLVQKERELERMKKEAEEITSLKQQNFLLQSKLRSAEEACLNKNRLEDLNDSAVKERLQQMDKEIQEQEMLIKGYQQENEKLYLQMKAQQAKGKANEEAMFNENQTLLNQLAFTRDQLDKNSRPAGNICLMDHTRRITDLLAQIDTFQRNEAKLCEDVHRLTQEKQALQLDLQLMKKERHLAKTQAVSASGDRTLEVRMLEEKHREEVSALKKKLQWFAENQELLDRDAGRLKAATAEILQLKEQVEKLKSEVSRRSSEQQRKTREKTLETKKMQDLERQVKELEQILRRRNPNSLPALIYAAASAGGSEDAGAAKTSPPSRINALLERRIQRLEAELESHDEEAKRSLRSMEQQFHRIKLRYEQQISDLEQQLEQKQQLEASDLKAAAEPWTSQVQTLEEELRRIKETHQEKEKSLQDQIESLRQQLKQKAQPSPSRHQRQAEAAFGVRIDRLNQELAAKTRTVQELSHTVERLQKERRNMLSGPKPRPEPRPAESKRQAGAAKSVSAAPAGEACGGEETFPAAAQYEKTYQPTIFTGSHISEVLQENEDLKRDLELLQQQSEQDREALKADAAQAREELDRLQGESAERLSSLKAEHLRVLDQLRAAHALEHSASKVAELTNKLHSQEILVKHLQERLKELQGAKDALVISRTREDALQKQLTRLLQELKEAKEAQNPEVKLMCSLEKKIFNMELRHQHREKELQQVIGSSWQTSEADQQSEVERWKRLAQDKSRELEAFRLELDSILDILRHLQRQGVVLTPITTLTAPTSTQRS